MNAHWKQVRYIIMASGNTRGRSSDKTKGSRRSKKSLGSARTKNKQSKGKVEYVRFKGLERAVGFALSETLRKFTLQRMQECYPDIEPEVLEYIRKQMIDIWKKKAEAECAKIYTERDLRSKLDALDEIVFDAEKRQSRKDPNVLHMDQLKPEEVVQSQLITLKDQALRKMEKSLKVLRYHKKRLLKELQRTARRVESDSKELDGIAEGLRDLSGNQNEPDDSQFEELIRYAVDGDS